MSISSNFLYSLLLCYCIGVLLTLLNLLELLFSVYFLLSLDGQQ